MIEVDVVAVVELYGGRVLTGRRNAKGFTKASCPFHGGDRTPSASVRETGYFCCFSCGVSGHIVDVVAEVQGISSDSVIHYLTANGVPVSSIDTPVEDEESPPRMPIPGQRSVFDT